MRAFLVVLFVVVVAAGLSATALRPPACRCGDNCPNGGNCDACGCAAGARR